MKADDNYADIGFEQFLNALETCVDNDPDVAASNQAFYNRLEPLMQPLSESGNHEEDVHELSELERCYNDSMVSMFNAVVKAFLKMFPPSTDLGQSKRSYPESALGGNKEVMDALKIRTGEHETGAQSPSQD